MNPFTMEVVLTLPKDVSQTERTVLIGVSQVNHTPFCDEVCLR